MKLAILPLIAISLVMAMPADAPSVQAQSDIPRLNDAPRRRRERELGLEGNPRGQRELSAPYDVGYSLEEPDDDDDDADEVLPSGPRTASQPL